MIKHLNLQKYQSLVFVTEVKQSICIHLARLSYCVDVFFSLKHNQISVAVKFTKQRLIFSFMLQACGLMADSTQPVLLGLGPTRFPLLYDFIISTWTFGAQQSRGRKHGEFHTQAQMLPPEHDQRHFHSLLIDQSN